MIEKNDLNIDQLHLRIKNVSDEYGCQINERAKAEDKGLLFRGRDAEAERDAQGHAAQAGPGGVLP